jgi:hypothetical protein
MEENLLLLEAWQAVHHATTTSPIRDELVNMWDMTCMIPVVQSLLVLLSILPLAK